MSTQEPPTTILTERFHLAAERDRLIKVIVAAIEGHKVEPSAHRPPGLHPEFEACVRRDALADLLEQELRGWGGRLHMTGPGSPAPAVVSVAVSAERAHHAGMTPEAHHTSAVFCAALQGVIANGRPWGDELGVPFGAPGSAERAAAGAVLFANLVVTAAVGSKP